MPTYAYACKTCGHRFDAVQSFSEPALTECPSCGGVLRKQYGSIGVTFNGAGFYRTDSRSGGSATTGGGSGGGESSASGSSTPATSSKPAGSSSSSAGSSSSSAGSSSTGS